MMDKVRFGLVGTGRITDWVLRGAAEDPRFEARAVCSRDAARAEAFAASHGIPLTFTDIDEMAASPEVDAIYIGTPNHTHCDIALRCMEAGKHVLCEKPMASNAAQAQAMADAAAKHGVVLMEAMISTLAPNFRTVAQMLPGLGPMRSAFTSFCQYSSKYDALKRGEVAASFDPRCSGGALMDLGIYTIWPLVSLFGRPCDIVSRASTMDIPGVGRTDVGGTVLLGYDGFTATAVYSKAADSFLPTEFCAEGGALVMDKVHICKRLVFYPHAAPTSGRGEGAKAQDIGGSDVHDEYFYEFREFIDCVLVGRCSSVNSPELSVAVMEILDQVRMQAGILAI